jgi:DNA-binding NarL/FixJ family response regulator
MMVPFDQGRIVAAGIPDAKFVELETNNHVLISRVSLRQRWQEVSASFGWQRRRRGRAADAPASATISPCSRARAQILDLVAGGNSNHDIATKLFISEKTVRNHLTGIFDKLGVSSRSQPSCSRGSRLAGRPNYPGRLSRAAAAN